jgi:hypothetical protein
MDKRPASVRAARRKPSAVLLAFSLTAVVLAGQTASAVVLDFTTDQYTPNFRETFNTATLTWDEAAGNVRYSPATVGQTGIAVYDTDPLTATNDATFLAETISLDVSINSFAGTNGPSAGIYGRVQGDSLGVLGLLNVLGNSTTVRLRLFSGAQVNGTGVGTTIFDSTFDLATGSASAGGIGSTNSVALDTPITLTLTQTADADPVFSFTVSDAQGQVASTGAVTLLSTVSNAFDGAGAVGFRMNQPTVGNVITVDNFAVIPEPSSFALLGASVGFIAARRRRRV